MLFRCFCLSYFSFPSPRGVTFTTTPPHSARYHSHGDSPGRSLGSQGEAEQTSDKDMAVLPMSVMEPTKMATVQAV